MPTSSQARLLGRWDIEAMSRQQQGEASESDMQYTGQADITPRPGNIEPGQTDVTLSHARVSSGHTDVTPSCGNINLSQSDVTSCHADVSSCPADDTSCPEDVCLSYADGPSYDMAEYRWRQADVGALSDMFGGASLNNSNIDNNGGEDDAPPPPAAENKEAAQSNAPSPSPSPDESASKQDHPSRRFSRTPGHAIRKHSEIQDRRVSKMDQDRKTPRMDHDRRISRMEQDRKMSKMESRKKVPRADSVGYKGSRRKSAGPVAKNYESDSSSSRSASRLFQFEIDLLEKRSSGSIGPESEQNVPNEQSTSIDRMKSESKAQEVEEETPVDQPKSPPKPSMKNLFKQLLTIGMSSNAFRGITVRTSSGESKAATEQEAAEALDAMVTDMVPEVEEEEEDDDEDVELVMGSLLCDVATHIEVPTPAEKRPKPRPKPRPDLLKPLVPTRPVKSDDGVTAKTPTAPTEAALSPAVGPSTPVSANMDLSEVEGLLAHQSSAVDSEPEKPKNAQMDFLKDVVSGNAFTSGTKAKAAAAAKPASEPKKKKVLKIPPIRLRHTIPVSDPSLLCIRTPNVDLTHEQVKNMLDAQLGNITSLQHVPEYLQNGDVAIQPRVMWIFRMEDTSTNNYVRICTEGIMGYDGENLRIRLRDDIFTEEHRAFQLVQQIKSEQNRMNKQKNKPKPSPSKPRDPAPS